MAGLLPFEFPLGHEPYPMDIDLEADFPTPPRSQTASPVQQQSRPRQLKRNMMIPLMICRNLPQTSMEWKRVLAFVKRDYQNGKYRACLSRCNEVLDNIRQLTHLQAAHLIYLHFYAACALEMQFRSMQHSTHRVKLLKQARDHLARAFALVKIEDEDINSRWRSSSAASSYNMHSPCSSTSTRMLSPTPSLTFSDCETQPVKIKRRKRVRFSNPIIAEPTIIEPMIRPDSPTLGFDDMTSEVPSEQAFSAPVMGIKSAFASSPTAAFNDAPNMFEFEDPFARDRSIHRYSTILDSLRRQIATHLAAIDAEVAAAAPMVPQVPLNDEMRALDLQTRIARLKANGWQRRRFDASRYEALRERAMADLMG
ncbi:hypothetical protein NLU13_2972 [Sarocladium strictum]|uniref:Uncharacterized protein n=1 Tax=Sarocladium strictum TaxID=5046 RepID=A0AA39GNU1_SARSR|nr:hypothetical protein NLU13_2972 [Sarocladium strictum]